MIVFIWTFVVRIHSDSNLLEDRMLRSNIANIRSKHSGINCAVINLIKN